MYLYSICCPHCGKRLEYIFLETGESQEFCPYCNYKLSPEEEQDIKRYYITPGDIKTIFNKIFEK